MLVVYVYILSWKATLEVTTSKVPIKATFNWTRMIDFDFSAVLCPICRQTSAEVKSYTQNYCYGTNIGSHVTGNLLENKHRIVLYVA